MNAPKHEASSEFRKMGSRSRSELEAIIQHGEAPEATSMVGWEYRGMNTGPLVKYVGLQKFIKGFFNQPDATIMGYNIAVRQNGVGAPWVSKSINAAPGKFGFYRVCKVDITSMDNRYVNAILLDYSKGRNGAFNIIGLLRDYLVRIERGSDDLLLGKAYLAIGRKRVMLGYFVLERLRMAGKIVLVD